MRVWTVFDAMFKNSRIEAGTNKNIPCMESYADFKMAVGANRIVRQASPALDTQCPMTCSRTTGRRGARSDRPEQQEADISVAKNEISDLGTESHDTKQELKLQNCAERGTAGLNVEKFKRDSRRQACGIEQTAVELQDALLVVTQQLPLHRMQFLDRGRSPDPDT